MNKLQIAYIPKKNTETYIIESINYALALSQEDNACLDLVIFNNVNKMDINISNSLVSGGVLQQYTQYVETVSLLDNIKSFLRINKNTVVLNGYDIDLDFIKNKIYPILNEFENITICINIIDDNKELNLPSFYTCEIEEDMDEEEWKEIEAELKDAYEENLNKKEEDLANQLIGKFLNSIFGPMDYYPSDSEFVANPIKITLNKDNDEYSKLEECYECVTFTDKNNNITIERTNDDLITILDSEGNKIILNQASKDFLLKNL